jgi:hypothetical protein
MTQKIHLWIEDIIEKDGSAMIGVTIEKPNQERDALWYKVPCEYRHILTKSCDPFVVGTIFIAMRESMDLIVHGEVSPSLLRNIDEFQEAWMCWLPARYAKIEIVADTEKEQAKADSDAAIVTFSGGVDSCFTAWRHKKGTCGRLKQNLDAGLMIHGFDIPLEQDDVFARAADKSKILLNSLGVEMIPIATNFKNTGQLWDDCHGAGVASCLMALQGGFTKGLIGSSAPYSRLHIPFGSNPVTDHLFSSNSFRILHDGAAYIRREKIREISKWPEALKFLRVCYEGVEHDRNCCKCEKCIRTILSFRVMGLNLPECFEQDVRDGQILALTKLRGAILYYFEEILSQAKVLSISESWVTALDKCIKRNKRALGIDKGLIRKLRNKVAFRKRLRKFVEGGLIKQHN